MSENDMTIETLRERVARAIAPYLPVAAGSNPDCDDQNRAQDHARSVARAALSAIPIPATEEVDHSKLIGDLRTVFGGESEGWSTIRTATLERAIAALLIPATGELEKALRKAAARLRLASDGPEDKATIRKWSDEALAATKDDE